MTYAKYINSFEDLDKLEKKISMVYIGNDFCDRIKWDFSDILKLYHKTTHRGLKLGLKTPFITESTIEYFQDLMKNIANASINIEVVINDFGLLDYIEKNGYLKTIQITMGRLLCRQKTDKMTKDLKGKVSDTVYQHFCTPVALANSYSELIRKYHITAFEFENIDCEVYFPKVDFEYRIVLTYPYVSVGSTRLCPYIEKQNEVLGIWDCNYECKNKKLYIKEDLCGEYVYINNTIAYKNERLELNGSLKEIDCILDEIWR